jgi:uncharacterized repeat protein (TIGR03803 family)
MQHNRRRTAVSTALAVMTLTLIASFVLAPSSWAANQFKVLHEFTGGVDGDQPQDALIADAAGNLYGTSLAGGSYGAGTVFKLAPDVDGTWKYTVLYAFTGGTDGGFPIAGLIFDAGGNLYGTTSGGGDYRAGVAYKLSPKWDGTWTESVLWAFSGGSPHWDGASPGAGLIFDPHGNLYGRTRSGPHNHDGGAAFKLKPQPDGSWTEKVLHPLLNNDYDIGLLARTSIMLDAQGALYGNEISGGDNAAGDVFKLTSNRDGTWTYSYIYLFATGPGTDGVWPEGPLMFDNTGNLYGTTAYGGTHGYGTVFKLTQQVDGSWKELVLYNFMGGESDGAFPVSGVVSDTAGNLYGTTMFGGPGWSCVDARGTGCGTVFKLTPGPDDAWTESLVHIFPAMAAGNPYGGTNPTSALLIDRAGHLYGTTGNQDTNHHGTVFEITQ